MTFKIDNKFFDDFLGAPVIKNTRNQIELFAALTAVTAAAVGLILNLGITLANHKLWQTEVLKIHWISVTIAVIAFIALQRYKIHY